MTAEELAQIIFDAWGKAPPKITAGEIARRFAALPRDQIRAAVVAEGLEPRDRFPTIRALNARLLDIERRAQRPEFEDITGDERREAIADAFEFWQAAEPTVRRRGVDGLKDSERWRASLRILAGMSYNTARRVWCKSREPERDDELATVGVR